MALTGLPLWKARWRLQVRKELSDRLSPRVLYNAVAVVIQWFAGDLAKCRIIWHLSCRKGSGDVALVVWRVNLRGAIGSARDEVSTLVRIEGCRYRVVCTEHYRKGPKAIGFCNKWKTKCPFLSILFVLSAFVGTVQPREKPGRGPR
jgi:hypothetical protein